jgi:hypothetical protein
MTDLAKAREAVQLARDKVLAAQAFMHKTVEFKATTAALEALYAARYEYLLAHQRGPITPIMHR